LTREHTDRFGRPQPQVNWRTVLIAGFIIPDLLMMAAIGVWWLLR